MRVNCETKSFCLKSAFYLKITKNAQSWKVQYHSQVTLPHVHATRVIRKLRCEQFAIGSKYAYERNAPKLRVQILLLEECI